MGSAQHTDRLTSYAHGGGCACKIPPGALESVVAGLVAAPVAEPAAPLIVGLDNGDDAAVVQVRGDLAVISTADFFTPVVDDPYDWGASPRPTPCPTSTRWAALRWWRSTAGVADRPAALRGGRRGAARRPGRRCRAGLPRGRWAQRRRPRTEVRHGGDRNRRPGSPDAQRRRTRRHPAVADQAAGHRCPQQPPQEHRRGVPAGDLGDDHAQRPSLPRRRLGRDHVRDGCDRLRSAGAPVQAGPRQRGVRRRRCRRGRVPGRRPRRARRRLRQRRHPAQPRLGPPAPGRLRERGRAAAARRRPDVGLLLAGEIPGLR